MVPRPPRGELVLAPPVRELRGGVFLGGLGVHGSNPRGHCALHLLSAAVHRGLLALRQRGVRRLRPARVVPRRARHGVRLHARRRDPAGCPARFHAPAPSLLQGPSPPPASRIRQPHFRERPAGHLPPLRRGPALQLIRVVAVRALLLLRRARHAVVVPPQALVLFLRRFLLRHLLPPPVVLLAEAVVRRGRRVNDHGASPHGRTSCSDKPTDGRDNDAKTTVTLFTHPIKVGEEGELSTAPTSFQRNNRVPRLLSQRTLEKTTARAGFSLCHQLKQPRHACPQMLWSSAPSR
mmetsp:Transcript_54356/g.128369  ORF Transcript_54356/g.128369 Transcript_54356/m.128369 type:complete len:293 (+) Transcript_54356:123-1001(+)